jgi:uncharacterized membrane protein YjdF
MHNLLKFRINMVIILSQIIVLAGLALGLHFDYIRSVLVTTGIWLVYMFLEARYKLDMNNFVRIAIGITLVSDSFFGYYLDLYARSSVFDKILHVFGTYALSLFTYILVVQLLKNAVCRPFKFILVICLGTSIGAIYEIAEFITDNISQPALPSQPSLLDTDLDLIGDVIGAAFAAIHAVFRNFINRNF